MFSAIGSARTRHQCGQCLDRRKSYIARIGVAIDRCEVYFAVSNASAAAVFAQKDAIGVKQKS